MSEVEWRVEHDALLDELTETQRNVNYWQARQQYVLATLARDTDPGNQMPEKQWVREEVACELKIAPQSASWRQGTATDMVEHFGAALKLVEAGELTMRYLWILHEETRHLDSDTKRAVLERVLDRSTDQSPAAFTKAVRRAVLAAGPEIAEQQRKQALEDRKVSGRSGEHGMSSLYADLATEDQAAILDAVDTLARQWATVDGEIRTLEQLRADAFVRLTLGEDKPQVTVNVTVALSTLTGQDDEPAELDDGTSITAAQARLLAHGPTSTWRRLITDPAGQLVDYGRTKYRPPAPLADFVRVRDRVCSFPHCTRPARRCDLDHRTAWEHGGCTNEHNLHPLCERHHNAKHQAGWWVTRLDDGTNQWTSPTGRIYLKPPWTYPIDRTGSAPDDP